MKPLFRIALSLLLAAAARASVSCADAQTAGPTARPADNAIAAGRYLALAGDCIACHTRPGGVDYAGGLRISTPFGSIYSTNLTPDRETGLGDWTADDFWQAMHSGISKNRGLLYPAFPFENFTKLTREDSDSIFAYLRSLPAARNLTPSPQLRAPFNRRWLLWFWRKVYFSEGSYEVDSAHSARWNRGAYLVQGLGHCDACHSRYSPLGSVEPSDALQGGFMPVAGWYAPAITGKHMDPDLPALLHGGLSDHGVVVGPMASVIYNSLQYLSTDDTLAMTDYLASLPSGLAGEASDVSVDDPARISLLYVRGKIVYARYCQDCHSADGSGHVPDYPALAGNQALLQSAVNPVRVIANGGFAPATAENPRPFSMPAFVGILSNDEIAAVATYVRRSWGNNASAVAEAEVDRDRIAPEW